MGQEYIGEDDYDDDDEFSSDQVLGDDELEDLLAGDQILGADKRKVLSVARQLLNRSKQVRKRKNKAFFQQIMPLPVVTVSALATASIEANPQWTIRVERLVVPSWVARFFDITQFNVGQQPQYVNTGSVNCSVFSEVAIGVRLKGDTANLGNEVTLWVQNIDTVDPHDFRGTIFGTVLKP